MNDESGIAAGIMIVGILLPIVAPLAIMFFMRRRIPALAAVQSIYHKIMFRLLRYQWIRIPVGLFIGLMIATAGGALHPPLLTVAAPVLCNGDMAISSQNYSYKPGQRGTAYTIRCEREGRVQEVTLRAIGVSTLIYGAGAWILLTLLYFLSKRQQDENPTGGFGTGFSTGSGARVKPDDIVSAMAQILKSGAQIKPEDLIATFSQKQKNGTGSSTILDLRQRTTSSSTTLSGGDAATRLRQLKALRDQGLISAQDYESRKQEILNEL